MVASCYLLFPHLVLHAHYAKHETSFVMLRLDEQHDGKILELHLGSEFELRLHENPTAGYRWKMGQHDGTPICKLIGDSFNPGTMLGETGFHSWKFKMTSVGRAKVDLVYARAWDVLASNKAFSFQLVCQA